MPLKSMILAAGVFAAFALSGEAAAANAFTTGNVNMRAGPSVDYPRITTIRAGASVQVHGCVRNWSWCDTSWRGYRGWVSGRYLQLVYRDRRVYLPDYGPRIGLPIISFQIGTYWDRHYRDRRFYRDRDRWHRTQQPRQPAQVEQPRATPPGLRGRHCPPGLERQGRCTPQ
jgi:uncharacterized protein YraI